MNEKEACELCGELTGMDDEGEDSLYGEWRVSPPDLKSRKMGERIGPLCPACFDCLYICGFINEA